MRKEVDVPDRVLMCLTLESSLSLDMISLHTLGWTVVLLCYPGTADLSQTVCSEIVLPHLHLSAAATDSGMLLGLVVMITPLPCSRRPPPP